MLQKRFSELSVALKDLVVTSDITLSTDEGLRMARQLIGESTGITYVVGNGGSAGIASHFSNDLLKAIGIRSTTLSDASHVTCLGNDLGYENVYSHQLNILLKPVDVLVAISSSGQSENILKAVQGAKSIGCKVITLSGFLEDNPLRYLGDLNFYIEKSDYGLVEMAHFFILHTLIDLWKPLNDQAKCEKMEQTFEYAP